MRAAMCFSHVDNVSSIIRVRIRPISSSLDGCKADFKDRTINICDPIYQ